MYQSPELSQRIVRKPNLHYGRQDTTKFGTRASVDHLSSWYGETRSGGEYGETRCGNIDFRRIQGWPHFNRPTTRWHPQGISQKVDSSIWNASKSRSVESWLGQGSSVQPIQREVEGHNPQHGKHVVLRDVRDHFQSTVPQLFNILDDRHCILYLRNMLATFRQKSQFKLRSVWFVVLS